MSRQKDDCAGRNGVPAHGKHTPGPWVVWYSDWPGVVGVECASGETIADCSHSNDPDLSEANARLIATAPELLEALVATRALVSEAAMTGFNCHDGTWAERLYSNQASLSAAIAKAEGRS